VPVNFARLRRPRRDMVLVATAGPGINMAMALTAALLVARIPAQPGDALEWIGYNLFNAVWINVLLAVFNMLPLPPLDGGRVAVGLLPDGLARPLSRLEPYGFFIILGLLFVLPLLGDVLGIDIGIVQWLVIAPAEWLSRAIFALVGAT
jgi:Zn-dependent protease